MPLASLSAAGLGAERLLATVDARVARDGAVTGDVGVRYGALRLAGATRVAARDGELGAHVEELRVDPATPLATRGLVTVSAARPRSTPRRRACTQSPTASAPPCTRASAGSRPMPSTPSSPSRACG